MFDILIVEDDNDINELLSGILKRHNYNTRSAYSGSEAMLCLEMFKYDIILLDLMLPGICGEEIIKKIRELDKGVPIIVISAKDNKVEVLRMGADDFISKPFDIEEVIARIEVQLRKNPIKQVKKNQKIEFKNMVLDLESRQAFVNEYELSLTAREFDIIALLVKNPHKVFTKVNLFESVWNTEFLGDDNTVSVHISNIRSKISKSDDIEYIKTVWGIGFKLNE